MAPAAEGLSRSVPSAEPWPEGSRVFWQALSAPSGLDAVTQDEDGTVRFVTLRLYQDAAPLQPLPVDPVPRAIAPLWVICKTEASVCPVEWRTLRTGLMSRIEPWRNHRDVRN
jgi:hypothetical protein